MPAATFIPSLTVEKDAAGTATALKHGLREAGLTVATSFQLESACAADSEPCPHHGETPCRCHLILLAVDGFPLSSPCLIRIHSDAGRSIVQPDRWANEREGGILKVLIQEVLHS
jgi:hypothetical protein